MYKKKLLENGVKLICVPLKNTSTVTILLLVKTGSKNEKNETLGLSHFLEHMFFKGTKKRPTTIDITKNLDAVGGIYNAFTGKEYTGFWVKVNMQNFDIAADVISDMILNSKFEQAEINKEKGTIIEEMNMYFDNPIMYVPTLFESLLYKNQPLGNDEIGTKKTINEMKRKDFIGYYKEYYTGENITISVCGNMKINNMIKTVETYFKGISNRKSALQNKSFDVQTAPNSLIHYRDTDQTHICLGVRGYSVDSDDKYILDVISVILGGNMSSRLFISVREKNGLAYYINSSSENYKDVGYMVTRAGLSNEKCLKAVSIILDEFKKLREKGVGKSELEKAKTYIKGRMTISLESSDSMASFVAMQEMYNGIILTPKDIFDKIDSVGIRDIKRVANEVFTNKNLNLALIGPVKNGVEIENILSLK